MEDSLKNSTKLFDCQNNAKKSDGYNQIKCDFSSDSFL